MSCSKIQASNPSLCAVLCNCNIYLVRQLSCTDSTDWSERKHYVQRKHPQRNLIHKNEGSEDLQPVRQRHSKDAC